MTLLNQTFQQDSGDATTFTFNLSEVGTISGYESLFWTDTGACGGTPNSALNGTFVAGSSTSDGTTSSMTLAQVAPAVYSLCYHDGNVAAAGYTYMPSIQLTIKGTVWIRTMVLWLWLCACMHACVHTCTGV